MPVSTVKLNGTTLMTVNDTTATQGDVINKYFYAADGTKTLGTASGGITPTGNINITQAGQTDVTQYATATVPTAEFGLIAQETAFITESGERKWRMRSFATADPSEGGAEGWLDGEYYYGEYWTRPAVPRNTTITPSTSAQTIGGSTYMMEGPVTVSAMPSGTAGTPTATKGTVSNHSVSVTPSVTNTTGYITGSTKTGTAVSVTASELVSGTYTVSASGTHDVTNYASASVASGTATASATKGTVSNHSVTVTPSVTRTAGYITAGSSSGTAVTVSASELVSGSQTITQNGTVDVTNLASVTVDVQGGGSTGPQMGQASRTLASASSSISFTGLQGEPTSFLLSCTTSLTTGASPFKVAAVVFDGTNLHGQIVTNTSNAQATYDGSSFSKTYSNGTLTVSSTGPYFQATEYALDYSYGGTSANVVTRDVQVGSGATSIQFTNLPEATLLFYSVIFKSNFSTSSGYQRVMWEGERFDGEGGFGMAMDSQANVNYAWSTYGAGTSSMTVSSDSTSRGGYFHQPGYYQLTAVYEDIEPQEIDVVPLSVTTNGTYTAPSGTAYSPVTVNVSSGGSATVATTTWSNTDASATSHTFTGLSGTPKAAFLRCTSSLSRSSSSSNYFVADMRWTGTAAAGNSYRRSNGSYANVTSGYSFSASGTSLTVTTTGTSTSNPGSFYNGTYELTYIY